MNFRCQTEEDEWEGTVNNLIMHSNTYEFLIQSRSSIMTILGKTSRGGFACFPDFQVGCHLVNLKNQFWNSEQLISVLGKVDGMTVSAALVNLSHRINI